MARDPYADSVLARPFPEDFMRNVEHQAKRRAQLEREAKRAATKAGKQETPSE